MTPRPASAAADAVESAVRFADTDLASEPFFLMARASSLGSSAANRRLAELDLKVRSYSVLSLACSGQAPTQRELSQFLALDPSQIVAIVDELEARGAVDRQPDPRDRRSKIIVPTAAGRRLYERARGVVQDATAESLAALDAGQRRELHRLLSKVAL
ncbi:Multiple antibiotic resistance protein MarR [Arthrobacter saudimassiliensis]|uniref:Multiple antibiotic resistance protein MarR n=1 Tax=Arthrobacter saudimassiliensis TaxID=1461584 RepID=A0A078MW25_9MICC|nr:Multiple antibiotic resistance protein MarR [Arthrobacter saudimassiliensis]